MPLRLAALAATCLLALACQSPEDQRAEYLAAAEEAVEEKDYPEALRQLRNALRVDPQNPDTNLRIAQVLELNQNLEDAVFFYSETHRLDPERVDAALHEAALLIFDDPVRVSELLALAEEKQPENPEIYVVRSRRALIEGDVPLALQNALTAERLDPEYTPALLQLGKTHQARISRKQQAGEEPEEESFVEALAALKRAEKSASGDSLRQALLEQGRLFSAWKSRVPEAGDAFKRAAEVGIEQGNFAGTSQALALGQRFAIQQQDSELLAWMLEQRVLLQPEGLAGWRRLAQLRQAQDGSGQAVLERMIEANPESPTAHVQYARYLSQEGKLADAVAHMEEQIQAGVDPPAALGGLANLLRENGRIEESDATEDRLQKLYPDHPRAHMARAQQLIRAGNLEEAAKVLRDLVGNEERQNAYELLAETERRLGNRTAALDASQRAVELARGGPFPEGAMRLRGQLHAELGNCDEAVRSFSAITRSKRSLSAVDRFLQGRCLYDLGREKLGEQTLRNMIKNGQGNPWVLAYYAEREAKRRPAEVREMIETALNLQPNNPQLLGAMARLDIAEGQPGRALERLNVVVAAGKANPAILLERARLLAARGELDDAQRDALQAFEAQPDLDGASSLLIQIYARQGKTDEAIASFEEAQAVGALRAPAQTLLARMHMVNGNDARARELMEELLAENSDLPSVKNDLAYLLAKASLDLERAQTLAQEAQRSMNREPHVADTLGFVYLKRGLHGPALEQFRYALNVAAERDRVLPIFHFHAGLALQELDRLEEAAESFEKALALDGNYEDAAAALRAVQARSDSEQDAASSS